MSPSRRSSSPPSGLPHTDVSDQRLVLARPGRGEVREKRSRFLAFALPVQAPEQAAEQIERLRREYHDATHVPFAWKLDTGDSAKRRNSDGGEPPGTAGAPIAAAIESAGVTDTLVAIVRYFGGTKLGTGGLARAYREAAARALEVAGRRRYTDTVAVVVACPYDSVGSVRRLLRPPEISLVKEDFGQECSFRIAVVASRLSSLTASLDEAGLSYRIEANRGFEKGASAGDTESG